MLQNKSQVGLMPSFLLICGPSRLCPVSRIREEGGTVVDLLEISTICFRILFQLVMIVASTVGQNPREALEQASFSQEFPRSSSVYCFEVRNPADLDEPTQTPTCALDPQKLDGKRMASSQLLAIVLTVTLAACKVTSLEVCFSFFNRLFFTLITMSDPQFRTEGGIIQLMHTVFCT